ncbi:MAG: thiolase family protein [Deltaproteobacteria bacterium]|nr:thiolase family protein [Deltaproteobacteria bacterium]
MANRVYLVSAVRTPIGDFGGALRDLKPLDLVQPVLRDALGRAGVEPAQVSQVVLGSCLSPLDQNIARIASLLLGLPYEVPGYTVNCACSSGMQAVILGVSAIRQRTADVVVAGGVESMSNAPYILESARWGQRLRHLEGIDLLWRGMQEYPVGGGMGLAAERLAERYGLGREELDELSAYSHARALRATREGRFGRELLPLEVPEGRRTRRVEVDEHPREDATAEALARLKPAFRPDGVVTAGNASGMNDGAAAVVLASEERVRELGLRVLAEVKAHALTAVDPHLVGIAAVPAVRSVLAQAGLTLRDIDLLEINEAFASFYLACEKELGLDRERTNVNGSGISLGHPVGATGCRLIGPLDHELDRQGARRGVAALCAGGGVGTAVLLERES